MRLVSWRIGFNRLAFTETQRGVTLIGLRGVAAWNGGCDTRGPRFHTVYLGVR